jgi:hypothetical protein
MLLVTVPADEVYLMNPPEREGRLDILDPDWDQNLSSQPFSRLDENPVALNGCL